MADKAYKLTNTQEGPRGFESARHGITMIGVEQSTVAFLTDDELNTVKAFGAFDVEEADAATVTEITGGQSDNLPASGQVDPLAGKQAKVKDAQSGKDVTAKAAKAAKSAAEKATAKED